LADEVTTKLKKYIQDPNVTIILTQMNSKKVYLIGEVGKTGPMELTPGMTLLQAIATAGGISQLRQREEDLHPSHRRGKAAEDTRAIQASIEGRQLAQSHSESGRYDCCTVRQPE
jgi:protein involved in polysaccharide export with SLBB domain